MGVAGTPFRLQDISHHKELGSRTSLLLGNPDYLLEGYVEKRCQVKCTQFASCIALTTALIVHRWNGWRSHVNRHVGPKFPFVNFRRAKGKHALNCGRTQYYPQSLSKEFWQAFLGARFIKQCFAELVCLQREDKQRSSWRKHSQI